MTETPRPIELEVLMDRLPGVTVPCLVCGGRGSYTWIGDLYQQCTRCAGEGQDPRAESLRKWMPDLYRDSDV